MGQYFKIANLDKRQVLHPHKFDDGRKLTEFGCSGYGTMMGLAALLAVGNAQNGGDIKSNDPIIGSWAGDRISIIGDCANYYEPNYDEVAQWQDISEQIIKALRQDFIINEEMG